MRRRYVEWTNALDPQLRRAISDPAAWMMVFLIVLLVVGLAGVVPQTSTFFDLQWKLSLGWFMPPFIVGLVGGIIEKRRGLSAFTFGTIALIDSAFFQLFAWSLVAYSSRPGSLLLAAFPILLAAYHGHAYQASVRYPFQLLGTIAAAVGGALLSGANGPIVAVAAPSAVAIAFLLGSIARTRDQERRELEALKQALDAQVLQDRVREAERYKEMVLELRAHNHDAGNTLSSALINSESLLRAAYTAGTAVFPDSARDVVADLRRGLERLSNILSDVREVGNRESLPRAEIELERVVSDVVREVKAQHPNVVFHVDLGSKSHGISLYGGETTAHRLVSNLVLNACEGDGQRGASNVWIEATLDEDARRCEICVSDDGPGFSGEQLGTTTTVFKSSKPHGSGLGLYTLERLVTANQGAVSRGNRPGGGAQVNVLLPVSKAP